MASSKDITHQLESPKKLHYVSNLRTSLTALVIIHHAASSYGGVGRNIYQSTFHPQSSSTALIGFNAFNQSFFMGTFMYLGGHFSRKALERKGRRKFVKDRLYRLGLPTVAYTLIGAPFGLAIARRFEGKTVSWDWLVEYWKGMRGVRGPLWFTATLLSFDLSLAVIDWLKEKLKVSRKLEAANPEHRRHVSTPLLWMSLAATSAADFLVRTSWPCGAIFTPLKLNIGYVSQYIAAYIFGVTTPDVDHAVPTQPTHHALILVSAVSTLVLGQAFQEDPKSLPKMFGGWNALAAFYATWNNVNGYLVGTSLLSLFSESSGSSWGWLNNYACSAFIVHIPVQTAIGWATDNWKAGPVQKTAAVGAATVVASWAIGAAGSQVLNKLEDLLKRSIKNG